jgi:hypothetical protein
LRDWLHELRRFSSRQQAAAAIAEEPPPLREKFPDGYIADAWLGAYAEHVAVKIGQPPPGWALATWRFAPEPVFDGTLDSPELRSLALQHAPEAFRRRNIFTPSVDLPLSLRAGRPVKPAEEKRRANAERQRKFRKAKRAELEALRKLIGKHETQLNKFK